VEEIRASLQQISDKLERNNFQRRFSKVSLDVGATELEKLKGKAIESLQDIRKNLQETKTCQLPSRIRVGVAMAKLDSLYRRGDFIKKELKAERRRLGGMISSETADEIALAEVRLGFTWKIWKSSRAG